MATIKEQLEQKKHDFQKCLDGDFFRSTGERVVLTEAQAKIIKNAIPSIDYMLWIFKGDVRIPGENEDSKSNWGKVAEWMMESQVNIALAEAILYGKWKEIKECIDVKLFTLADEVNGTTDDDDVIHFPEDICSADEEDDDCRYCGEHGDCCDCFDIPMDCFDQSLSVCFI